MKPASIREHTDEELDRVLVEKRRELFGLKVKNRTGESLRSFGVAAQGVKGMQPPR